ncbi:MAG: hypothetical protein NVSMB14_10490 [Isosphaeraceae bacterium]
MTKRIYGLGSLALGFNIHNGDVPANMGEFETAIGLPSDRPSVPALRFQDDIVKIRPLPKNRIFVENLSC